MSAVVDGWYIGATRDHYIKDGVAICDRRVTFGASRDGDGERNYCSSCRKKILWMRRGSRSAKPYPTSERTIYNVEPSK